MANKEAYYFSHDSNARHDEKIVDLRMKHAWEGYGIYWAIIEKLRDSPEYKLSTNFNLLAFDLRTSNDLIKSIVTGFGLFTIDGDYFYSDSLKKRMLAREGKSEKARKAANKRWKNTPENMPNKSERNADAMQTHSDSNAIKGKEKKGKEIKRKERENMLPLDAVFNVCLSDLAWLSLFPENVHEYLSEFLIKLKKQNVKEKSLEDFQSHFANWFDLEKKQKVPDSENFPNKYDFNFEKKLQGNDLMKYHGHLKKLGWIKSSGPGGSVWNPPPKKVMQHEN